MKLFLSYILKGLIALLPIIILVWLLSIVYDITYALTSQVFFLTGNLISTITICVLMLVFLLVIGYIVDKNKEVILLKLMEILIGKIPIISPIYSTLKEAINLFSGKKTDNYLGVVWVSLNDYKIMGFVTKELEDSYWIFVPTTPNPTSGFLLNAKKDSVEKCDLSVADGFKRLVSLGIK